MSDALVPVGSPLRQIEVGLAGVADQATELAQAGDTDTLLHWLAQAEQLGRIIRDLKTHIESEVAPLLPRKSEHPVFGLVEVRQSLSRSWDWEALLKDLWPVLAERAEGDYAAMVDELLNVIGLTKSKQPRVTELKKLGLNRDEYSEVTSSRMTVTVSRKVKG